MRTRFQNCLLFSVLGVVVFSTMTSSSYVWAEPEHGGDKKATSDDSGEHSKTDDAADHPKGAPLDPKADLAIWSLVVFILFVLVLKVFAWGPLSEGLNKREQNIRADISAAEQARLKAEQMLAEHAKKLESVQDEVREILAEARRDAEHTKQDIVTHAQSEAEATKNRSIAEIERARDVALKQLFDVMASHVADATEHVLARSINEDDQKRLINDALAQFSEN